MLVICCHLLHFIPFSFSSALLRHKGVDLEAKNTQGETPLQLAVKNNMYQSIVALLHAGANTNLLFNGLTLDHAAANDTRVSSGTVVDRMN